MLAISLCTYAVLCCLCACIHPAYAEALCCVLTPQRYPWASGRVSKVVALDLSKGMLEQAKARATADTLLRNQDITFQQVRHHSVYGAGRGHAVQQHLGDLQYTSPWDVGWPATLTGHSARVQYIRDLQPGFWYRHPATTATMGHVTIHQ